MKQEIFEKQFHEDLKCMPSECGNVFSKRIFYNCSSYFSLDNLMIQMSSLYYVVQYNVFIAIIKPQMATSSLWNLKTRTKRHRKESFGLW